jgi:serine/threonine protein kinase
MRPEEWKRVREALEAALDLEGEARAAHLARLRAEDAALADSVEELLARDTDSVVDAASAVPFDELVSPGALEPGTRLGAYRVEGLIASGGMGSVYRAERSDAQFEKSVAVKLIKRGMDSEEILRRFRYERQVLAALEHPGIARLLDGGVSEDGQPYFVMEYVEGAPIDRWCEEQELSTEARLRLFQKVCHAVHYAHQRLVVHRDLKPSNILVTADGEPKLLDFGVARMLDPEAGVELSRSTGEQGFFGTPSYASPEQLLGERVTTATDVYSLGVVLYRLLAGKRPYELSKVSRAEGARLVCEVEPARPSRAAREEGKAGAALAKRLEGDLDTIVMMALRKEPERRYASAEQLADDVQRHLSGHPVVARRNTLGYRASKFLGRNRAASAIGAALVVSLLVGFLTSSQLYIEASAATEEAEAASAEAKRSYEEIRRLASTFIFDVSGDIASCAPRSRTSTAWRGTRPTTRRCASSWRAPTCGSATCRAAR